MPSSKLSPRIMVGDLVTPSWGPRKGTYAVALAVGRHPVWGLVARLKYISAGCVGTFKPWGLFVVARGGGQC